VWANRGSCRWFLTPDHLWAHLYTGIQNEAFLPAYRPDAHSISLSTEVPLLPVCRQAAVLFFKYALNRIIFQGKISHDPFKAIVLFLQVLHTLDLVGFHTTVFGLSIVKGCLANAMFPGEILDG
jgi:hypothetical protein